MKILIANPDKTWASEAQAFLMKLDMQVAQAHNGKDAQLFTYREAFDVIVLDMELVYHSAIEVLRYLKFNYPSIRLILTTNGPKHLESMGLEAETTKKLGISEVLDRPFTLNSLARLLTSTTDHSEWRSMVASPAVGTNSPEEVEMDANENEFTRIKISEFCSGNQAIFDHYIRLGPGKFIKILHRQEKLDPARLKHYEQEMHVEYIYFRTRDRNAYINFMNEIVTKAVQSSVTSATVMMQLSKSVAEKYIDEIYTTGLRPQLIEEGIKICQNMYDMIHSECSFAEVYREYESYDPPGQTHLFLTAFFSALICHGLPWGSQRTSNIVTMAALLHDIGKLRLPRDIASMTGMPANESQRLIYQTHPKQGVELLDKYQDISEAVKQVVYQHHELNDGTGFPNGTKANRIYPLAKIVGLANHFTELLICQKISPLEGLKVMAQETDLMHKYDVQILKALITGFTRNPAK